MIIVDEKKCKIKEEDKQKTFDRLIYDSNRRIDFVEQVKEIKEKEEKDRISDEKSKRKYNDQDWSGVYQARFGKFQEEKVKKIESIKNKKTEKERMLEQQIVDNINKTKKCNQKEIELASKRMYNDEIVKRKDKLEKLNKKYHKDEEESDKKIKSTNQNFNLNFNVKILIIN